jgi:hypothetical protein
MLPTSKGPSERRLTLTRAFSSCPGASFCASSTSRRARCQEPPPHDVLTKAVVDAGGLISYAADHIEIWRRAAVFVDKILKGAKPANLPIEQPTKFELVINLKAAKSMGLTIPQPVLLQADEVIQ